MPKGNELDVVTVSVWVPSFYENMDLLTSSHT